MTAIALALLGDDGRMVTGQVIAVDGGWGVAEGPRANRELHRVAPAHRARIPCASVRIGPPRGRRRLPRRRVLAAGDGDRRRPSRGRGGRVRPDGVPAAGVEVVVVVAGTDLVRATTTDAAGAFSVEVEAAVGDTIDIRATGPTVSGGARRGGLRHQPDPDRRRRRHDRVAAARPGRGRARPRDREPGLLGDGHAGPAAARTHRPDPTPPATDRASDGDGATPAGRPFLAVAGLAFVLAGIAMVVAWRSRSAGR